MRVAMVWGVAGWVAVGVTRVLAVAGVRGVAGRLPWCGVLLRTLTGELWVAVGVTEWLP